jgi:hypothetical protein
MLGMVHPPGAVDHSGGLIPENLQSLVASNLHSEDTLNDGSCVLHCEIVLALQIAPNHCLDLGSRYEKFGRTHGFDTVKGFTTQKDFGPSKL